MKSSFVRIARSANFPEETEKAGAGLNFKRLMEWYRTHLMAERYTDTETGGESNPVSRKDLKQIIAA